MQLTESLVKLINLRHRLDGLPSRCQERRILIEETAALYGVSVQHLNSKTHRGL